MKALFVHETRYAKRDDGVFSSSHFSAQAWERYLDVFDSLQVVGRAVLEGDATDAMVRSDRDRVRFETLPDLNSIGKLIQQRGVASRQLAQLVEGVDAVILRGITGLGALAHRAARRAGGRV